jgi:Rab3 GTPase-activating protein catalytic subunit
MFMSHLSDPELVLSWDNNVGNNEAHTLAQRGGVSPATLALVAAMDWETTASEVISEEEAQQLVQESVLNTELEQYSTPQFRYAAPPGRVLSILCTHLTSLRSLCSMAVVWCVFCQELREQWEQRRSLSNLHDGVATAAAVTAPETMGAKSTNAGQLHSMEPNPELSSCLIQQKLQVMNVCVECQNAIEHRELEALEQQMILRQQQEERTSDGDSHASDEEFFDATEMEDGRRHPTPPGLHHRHHNHHPFHEHKQEEAKEDPSPQRKGARCPVQGATLQEANTQLYAPYLQRPLPLTDDIVAERRVMMARQRYTHVGTRLEIARRLQEPKLLSDMQAFIAANP